jgi:glycosyltransferase involved in cell wall biosynthesis
VRVLAFAYACEPGKGSEPGAGWGLARMLTELGETWVLTRANNREAIEAALPSIPEAQRLRFIYVDVPRWASWWKRGQRGVRLYYLLWLFAALRRAKQLQRDVGFHVVWHLTLANAWLGTTASLVGPRFIYGPVGGGVGFPWRLVPALGFRGALYEIVRAVVRAFGRYLNPLARLAWRRAELVLVQNPETRRWLPSRHRSKVKVFPNALGVDLTELRSRRTRASSGHPVALFAGRLMAWKGVSLALRALSQLPEWRLILIGTGPDERRLRRLADQLELNARVEFRGWQPREEVLRAMREEADVFLLPSLHDDASLAVAEALVTGLSVVCFDRGGPPCVGSQAGAVALDGLHADLVQCLREATHLDVCAFAGLTGPALKGQRSSHPPSIVRFADAR